jgi:NAD(P)-dependent dehydrogenase (short-subunit alcohol dehydrogenase family)
MKKVAVVTGGGSGVGQAVALGLASEGWHVAILGRTPSTLQETASQVQNVTPIVCDISHEPEVTAMVQQVQRELGDVQLLVNAAGTNVVERSLSMLTIQDYDHIVNINLRGAFLCVQGFLPGMRKRGQGTIVNVISDAGLTGNAISGAAYVASKFGLAGLTETINAEERRKGIRACGIYPGEIDTPLLKKRPQMPSDEARKRMLQADDVAACVMLAVNLPDRAVVEKLVVRPR